MISFGKQGAWTSPHALFLYCAMDERLKSFDKLLELYAKVHADIAYVKECQRLNIRIGDELPKQIPVVDSSNRNCDCDSDNNPPT